MQKIITSLCFIIILSITAWSQSDLLDEDALFDDSESVVTNLNSNFTSLMEKEELVFSGNILSRNNYSVRRSWFLGETPGDTNRFSAGLSGTFNLDLRLRRGHKAHLGMYINYSSDNNTDSLLSGLGMFSNMISPGLLNSLVPDTSISFPEFFVDLNISQAVYFRIGKQVLQWGRSMLWNPTDLINVDRESFLDDFQVKNGVPGIKMHIPFGTAVNIYTFLDASEVTALKDFALAGKLEVVLGRTEIGISGWAKEEFFPVYGFDFSSRIGLVDIYGEASLSEGENREQVGDPVIAGPVTNYETTRATNGFIPRISLGIRRSIRYYYDDRVIIGGEFYYNHSGYTNNVFADPAKINWMLINGYYRPYDHSRFYIALFTSINHFFDSTLTWSANVLANLDDLSAALATSLSYQPVYNLKLGLALNAFLGPEEAEFTLGDQGLNIQLTAQYLF